MINEQLIWKLVAIGIYFVLMLGIGVYFSKKTENLSDYILGGRGLGSWVAALSAQASDMSGWMLMGLPGAIYLAGMGEAWIGIGLAIGTYLNWLFVAKRLRNYTEIAGDSLTIPQFIENRFKVNKSSLRAISGIIIFFFFLIYTASGFSAGGKLFASVIGMDYRAAVILSMVIIVSYTFMGGFKAVCWTDFFQGSLMFVAVIAVPIVAIFALGGFNATASIVQAQGGLNIMKDVVGADIGAISIISSLAWGLGYCGMPHILVRFMAIKDANMIKKSRRIATVWVVVSLVCSIAIGFLGRALIGGGVLAGPQSETVFIILVEQLMPPFIAGVFIAAILAAIMSTADSQLLVVASAITSDIYPKFTKKEASQKTLVNISRGAIIVVAVIAALIALDPNSKVMDLVSYAWAGFGSAFGPVVLLALYWKRMTYKGAMAGMICGGAMVILWKDILSKPFGLYELVPGFFIAILAIVVVSLLDKQPSKEIEDEFDKVKSMV